VGDSLLRAAGKPKCMLWRDLDSFSGKNLYTLKCRPGQHVDFCGELLVKVACKWHLNPHGHVDPRGLDFALDVAQKLCGSPHG